VWLASRCSLVSGNRGTSRSALPIVLRDADQDRLSSLLFALSAPAGLMQGARIVLLAAQGASNTDVAADAARLKVSRQTVATWRQLRRF
jgi:hypothetical protein